MLIYLVRHAIAEDRPPSGADSAERALTKRGEERMRAHVRALASLDVRLDRILTSPYRRAAQTATVLSELPGFSGELEVFPALAPGGNPDVVCRRLAEDSHLEAVALVGHEPDLSDLVAYLLFSQTHSICRFKKGGVACLEYDPDHDQAVLKWLMTPKQLRMIV